MSSIVCDGRFPRLDDDGDVYFESSIFQEYFSVVASSQARVH